MLLQSLRVRSFRAHTDTSVAWATGVNVIWGPNGAGKTNLLEAIHYVCLTQSFLVHNDRYALRKDAPHFEVEGTFAGVRRQPMTVRLVYMPSEGKQVFVNGAPLERLADLVGQLPVVVFSPDDYELTAGGPDERRRFLNNILSQARPVYMNDVMQYNRARRQRNELLRQYKKRPSSPPPDVLDPWTDKVVTLGSRVIQRRAQFLDAFAAYLDEAHAHIGQATERPSFTYDTVGDLPDAPTTDDVETAFRETLARRWEAEQSRGTTLAGPQRDDITFRLDGLEVRRYGSQGQHRTVGMVLKLAQYLYLRDQLDTAPLLLLDDAFGKLDSTRTAAFLELLQSDVVGQSFITTTDVAPFRAHLSFDAPPHQAIHVARDSSGARVSSDVVATAPDSA
ncbi:DNA replication/repair protein RecF [Salisaeta longa]|uniref:DNA replication/repair protein RecF n=1 Tax=Salisaeta longa TaxID=503170 RepID=UPI0003B61855|nr:DNA replication/repair protein RecF [Salisaeta longa]